MAAGAAVVVRAGCTDLPPPRRLACARVGASNAAMARAATAAVERVEVFMGIARSLSTMTGPLCKVTPAKPAMGPWVVGIWPAPCKQASKGVSPASPSQYGSLRGTLPCPAGRP